MIILIILVVGSEEASELLLAMVSGEISVHLVSLYTLIVIFCYWFPSNYTSIPLLPSFFYQVIALGYLGTIDSLTSLLHILQFHLQKQIDIPPQLLGSILRNLDMLYIQRNQLTFDEREKKALLDLCNEIWNEITRTTSENSSSSNSIGANGLSQIYFRLMEFFHLDQVKVIFFSIRLSLSSSCLSVIN